MTAAVDPPGPGDYQQLVKLVASAFRIVQVHRIQSDELCAGCLTTLGRVCWHPCTQAQWANAVLDEYTAGSMSEHFAAGWRDLIDVPPPLTDPHSEGR